MTAMNIAELTIKQAAPQIFRRPVLCVSVNDELLHAATFMSIGPQIYVDGLVVTDDSGQKIVGRLGNQFIMYHILEAGPAWHNASVSELMDSQIAVFDASSKLVDALDQFEQTRFAFVPVTIDGKLAASLSLRDLLGLVSTADVKKKLADVGSSLISVSSSSSLGDVFRTITDRQIRNVGVKDESGNTDRYSMSIINDRKVLEFLISHEGRQAMQGAKGIEGLNRIPVSTLPMLEPKTVSKDVSVSSAAPILQDVSTPCILSDGMIVTPWDLVIKGLARG